jgi:hypothetical protein
MFYIFTRVISQIVMFSVCTTEFIESLALINLVFSRIRFLFTIRIPRIFITLKVRYPANGILL